MIAAAWAIIQKMQSLTGVTVSGLIEVAAAFHAMACRGVSGGFMAVVARFSWEVIDGTLTLCLLLAVTVDCGCVE